MLGPFANDMKKKSVAKHFKPYSIYKKRKTTINHAFASAIAPTDTYDENKVDAAIRLLGQDPAHDLNCVFCGKPAATWDHLVSLVKDSQLRGYGHQLGNLVPCCRACNESKGSKTWDEFLREKVPGAKEFNAKNRLIAKYLHRFASRVDLAHAARRCPREWNRYVALKQRIFNLMMEADQIAAHLRDVVVVAADHKQRGG